MVLCFEFFFFFPLLFPKLSSLHHVALLSIMDSEIFYFFSFWLCVFCVCVFYVLRVFRILFYYFCVTTRSLLALSLFTRTTR